MQNKDECNSCISIRKSSIENKKNIIKFIEDDLFQNEMIKQSGLSPLPNKATKIVVALFQAKYNTGNIKETKIN